MIFHNTKAAPSSEEWDQKQLRLNARRINDHGIAKDRILVAMEQVTEASD